MKLSVAGRVQPEPPARAPSRARQLSARNAREVQAEAAQRHSAVATLAGHLATYRSFAQHVATLQAERSAASLAAEASCASTSSGSAACGIGSGASRVDLAGQQAGSEHRRLKAADSGPCGDTWGISGAPEGGALAAGPTGRGRLGPGAAGISPRLGGRLGSHQGPRHAMAQVPAPGSLAAQQPVSSQGAASLLHGNSTRRARDGGAHSRAAHLGRAELGSPAPAVAGHDSTAVSLNSCQGSGGSSGAQYSPAVGSSADLPAQMQGPVMAEGDAGVELQSPGLATSPAVERWGLAAFLPALTGPAWPACTDTSASKGSVLAKGQEGESCKMLTRESQRRAACMQAERDSGVSWGQLWAQQP